MHIRKMFPQVLTEHGDGNVIMTIKQISSVDGYVKNATQVWEQ